LSYVMHPLGLGVDGIMSTIRKYVDGYSNRTGLTVKLRSTPKVDKLPLRIQRSLFRIVQEALANVHHHARATKVSVELRCTGDRLHLIITDNGRGMGGGQEETPMRDGVGIYGIRARARQLGGDLTIRTGPNGTTVHVLVRVRGEDSITDADGGEHGVI
jgi:two-component system, NarL family, sensor kinase